MKKRRLPALLIPPGETDPQDDGPETDVPDNSSGFFSDNGPAAFPGIMPEPFFVGRPEAFSDGGPETGQPSPVPEAASKTVDPAPVARPEKKRAKQRQHPAEHYHGHRARLREVLLQHPHILRDYEILELLLGRAILRADTKPMAKALLARFGTLRGLLDARPDEYRDIPGLGPGVTALLALWRESFARYMEGPVRAKERLCTPEAVASMARARLGRLAHEELWVAYLDAQNRLMSWVQLSLGAPSGVFLEAQALVRQAVDIGARGFILVHNHPGGNARPSGADIQFTRQLQAAAQALGLRFLDHVVVAEEQQYSIMRDGFL